MRHLGLRDHRDSCDHDHHQVHGIHAGQSQPPEIGRGATAQRRPKAGQVRMRENETAQGEEQIDTEPTDS